MVLCCDLQPAILQGLENDRGESLVRRTNAFLERAREDSGVLVGFVRVAFRAGHPEVHPNNELFSMIKQAGLLTEGSDGAALHPDLLVTKDDPVFTKRRVGAFSTTDLGTFLRGAQVTELVVFGVATGAVINSTVQHALDHDMKVTVLSDLCDDSIQARHDALITHVFPNQAGVSVCTGNEWLAGATREHPGIVTSALPK